MSVPGTWGFSTLTLGSSLLRGIRRPGRDGDEVVVGVCLTAKPRAFGKLNIRVQLRLSRYLPFLSTLPRHTSILIQFQLR